MPVQGSGVSGMSHGSVQPIPAYRPVADPRACPFCLRAVHSLREGKGHRYPCPCPDIDHDSLSAPYRGYSRFEPYPLHGADTPSVQGGGPNPLARTGSARGRSPEPRWQDIDNPFWVEEF